MMWIFHSLWLDRAALLVMWPASLCALSGIGRVVRTKVALNNLPILLLMTLDLFLGTMVISFLLSVLGWVPLSLPLLPWILFGAGLLLFFFSLRERKREGASLLIDLHEKELSAWHKRIIGIIGAVLFWQSLSIFIPPVGFDALRYHFKLPLLYLDYRKLHSIPWNWDSLLVPQNTQMVWLWGMALQSDLLAKALFFTLWVLLLIALFYFTRFYFSSKTALLAILFLQLTPVSTRMLYWTSALEVPGALAALWMGLFLVQMGRRGANLRELYLLVWIAGFATGIKQTLFPMAFLALSGALFFMYRSEQRQLFHLIGLLLAFLIAASPWRVMKWIVTGNPLWPYLFGGKYLLSPLPLPDPFQGSLREQWLWFGQLLFLRHYTLFPLLFFISWKAAGRMRSWFFFSLAALAGTLLFVSYNTRYWFPYYLFALPVFAEWFLSLPRRMAAFRDAFFIGTVFLSFVSLQPIFLKPLFLFSLPNRQVFYERTERPSRLLPWLEERFSPDKKIAFVGGSGYLFPAQVEILSPWHGYLPLGSFPSARALLQALSKKRYDVLIVHEAFVKDYLEYCKNQPYGGQGCVHALLFFKLIPAIKRNRHLLLGLPKGFFALRL